MKHLILVTIFLITACSATSVPTIPSALGEASTYNKMIAALNKPGTIVFEKHKVANWQVPLSGLLNLQHEKAIAANLSDKDEAIQIYAYTIKHPTAGNYMVDSGVSTRFADAKNNPDVSFIIKQAMNIPTLEMLHSTESLVRNLGSIDGVFLTHIHLDHIMGLTDINSGVPVYIGPGDASMSGFTNAVTQGTTDKLLDNVKLLSEWQFDSEGIIDVFGDGSFWAIHSPGHTPGATAYLAMTINGPELMLGDATHTKWGWEHSVEPGTYSEDGPASAVSLQRLVKLVGMNPQINVHPGHQSL